MLLVLCHLAHHRYAIPASQIVEALPIVELAPPLRRNPACAGLLHYRGSVLPVWDLCQWLVGQPGALCIRSRLIVAGVSDRQGPRAVAAFLVEKVHSTFVAERSAFTEVSEGGPLGMPRGRKVRARPDSRGLIYLLDVDMLLQEAEPGAASMAKEARWF